MCNIVYFEVNDVISLTSVGILIRRDYTLVMNAPHEGSESSYSSGTENKPIYGELRCSFALSLTGCKRTIASTP